MSRSYAIHLTVRGHAPRRAKAIQAAAAVWPFVDWSETEGQMMTSYAEGQLFGGQNEREFAAELTLAIWQANGAYCKVSVSAACLENPTNATYRLAEKEYAGWQSGGAVEKPEPVSEIQASSEDSSAAVNLGSLRIDVSLLVAQRRLLTEVTALAREYRPYLPAVGDAGLLEGLLELTEAIADAVEDAGKQTGQRDRCECELPATSQAACRASWPESRTEGLLRGLPSSDATSASAIRPTRPPWQSCRSWAMSTRKLRAFDRVRTVVGLRKKRRKRNKS